MTVYEFIGIVSTRPSFWVKVWLFFFLLFNRKEGKELINGLYAKLEESLHNTDLLHKKADRLLEQIKLN